MNASNANWCHCHLEGAPTQHNTIFEGVFFTTTLCNDASLSVDNLRGWSTPTPAAAGKGEGRGEYFSHQHHQKHQHHHNRHHHEQLSLTFKILFIITIPTLPSSRPAGSERLEAGKVLFTTNLTWSKWNTKYIKKKAFHNFPHKHQCLLLFFDVISKLPLFCLHPMLARLSAPGKFCSIKTWSMSRKKRHEFKVAKSDLNSTKKWPKNDLKLPPNNPKITQNCPNWPKNDPKLPKWPKNDPKWPKN